MAASLEELQAKRKSILAEIARRGGKAKAPGFAKQLADIDGQIHTLRTSSGTTTADNTGSGSTGSDNTGSGSTGSGGTTDTSHPTSDTIDTNAQGLSKEDASAIERAKALLGIGETFGRKIGDEFYADGSLGRQAEINTPEELAALQRAKDLAATIGNQTTDVTNLLSSQRGILDEARTLSPLEQEALGVARSGLAGLDAPEMEALRSAARANILGQGQADARALAKAQARNQVFGAAATAQNQQLTQNNARETRNLERDLLVKNIDIKQAAAKSFQDLVTNTEANRASRTNAASGQLANTTLADENSRRNASLAASANQGTLATNLGDRLRQLQEFNLNQAAAERAGRIGSIFGGIGTITNQAGLLSGEDFANKQFEASQAAQQKMFEIIDKYMKSQGKALGN